MRTFSLGSTRLAMLSAMAVCWMLSIGCAVSEVRAKVDHNPLPAIEKFVTQESRDKWRVYHKGEDRIEIVDTWPIMFLGLGYSAMHGDMRYKDGEYLGAFYLKTIAIGNLFIPQYTDLSASFVGSAVKPYMRSKMYKVLEAGKIPKDSQVITHSHSLSEYER